MDQDHENRAKATDFKQHWGSFITDSMPRPHPHEKKRSDLSERPV